MIQTAEIVLPTGQLIASSVDTAERTIEGLLVPWNEVGRPSVDGRGRNVKVRTGGLQLAAEVTGIDTHDRPTRQVSTVIAHEQRPEGIWGRLKVDTTPGGDALLAQVAGGKRLGLSVEAADMLLDSAADEIVGGTIGLVAHVDAPAFPSARVHTMTAALTPTPTEGAVLSQPLAPAPPAAVSPPPAAPAPAIDYAQLAAALAPQLQAATAPGGLPTSSMGLAPSAAPKPAAADPVQKMAHLQAQLCRGGGTQELHAALADITNSGLDLFQNKSAIGEKLWEGATYERQFVGLMNTKPLTQWKGTGWQWVNRPKMQDYAGDKAAIPTNTVSVDQVEWEAERAAGGWDIDRKFRDFGDSEFWSEFYAAQTESYLEISDERAIDAVLSYAFDITVSADYPKLSDGTTPAYTLPAGFGPLAAAATTSLFRAVAIGNMLLENTPRVRKGADYVLVNTLDLLDLLDITNLDLSAFLRLLKVDPEKFRSSTKVPAGDVVLGVKNASTFRELGETPIRVEALDVARAGIDSAVFGYTATSMNRPGGIIRMPFAAV